MADGLVFISRTTFTSVTSVAIDNCFNGTYLHYLVKGSVSSNAGSSTTSITGQLRAGGVSATGSDYRAQRLGMDNTSISGARNTGQTSFSNIIGDNKTGQHGYFELHVMFPSQALRTTLWVDYNSFSEGNISIRSRGQAHDLTTAYDGLTIACTAQLTGNISVWGYAAS